MGHDGHVNKVFGIQPKSNVHKIWIVFIALSIVTIVEVGLGIWKPEGLLGDNFTGLKWLNWIFIILTLYKAYYIAWAFMHMDGEKKWFRRSVVWTGIFLICYLTFILLVEGNYIYEVLRDSFVTKNF